MVISGHKHPLKELTIFSKNNAMETLNMAIFEGHPWNEMVLFGEIPVSILCLHVIKEFKLKILRNI